MVQLSKVLAVAAIGMSSSVMAIPTPASTAADSVTSSESASCLSAIESDLSETKSSMEKLQDKLDNYDGSIWDILELLGITGDTLSLQGLLQKTDKDADNCVGLDSSDTVSLATPFTDLLPVIKKLLATLVDKKYDFDHAILFFGSASPIVGTLTSDLKSTFDKIIARIEELVPSDFESIISGLGSEVDEWFTSAVDAYADSSFINLKK